MALVVQTVLGRDPYSGAIFVFRSKRGDRIKILVWDQTGLVLVYKHLEGGQFQWPRPADGVIRLSIQRPRQSMEFFTFASCSTSVKSVLVNWDP